MTDRPAPIGVVPAAGLGSRLRPFRYPKELLPVAFVAEPDGTRRPVLAAESALRALVAAGVERALVVVSDAKLELVRLLQDGSALGLRLAYVHQPEPLGLTDAVTTCLPWLGDAPAALVLPDTSFSPADALRPLRAAVERGADLALGVFPTDRPHLLGPVRADADGRVLEVLEKPARGDLANTWGCAAWGPAFSALLARRASADPALRRSSIGLAFDEAVRAGLDVRAVTFPGGRYADLGTAESLAELVLPAEATP